MTWYFWSAWSLDDEATRVGVARHLETTERKIEALTRLRRELRNTLNSCKGGRIAECRVIQALSAVAATRKKMAEGSSRT
jgi:hypothetical protein